MFITLGFVYLILACLADMRVIHVGIRPAPSPLPDPAPPALPTFLSSVDRKSESDAEEYEIIGWCDRKDERLCIEVGQNNELYRMYTHDAHTPFLTKEIESGNIRKGDGISIIERGLGIHTPSKIIVSFVLEKDPQSSEFECIFDADCPLGSICNYGKCMEEENPYKIDSGIGSCCYKGTCLDDMNRLDCITKLSGVYNKKSCKGRGFCKP
jgi:hypothetical protein